ncbi:MAG: hypothetical protein RLZZ221_1642, partial [Verrucomicrobiota bacterium]
MILAQAYNALAPRAPFLSLTAGLTTAQQEFPGLFTPPPGAAPAPPPRPRPVAPPTAGREDVVFERSPRARNYRLTLRRDGSAVATI